MQKWDLSETHFSFWKKNQRLDFVSCKEVTAWQYKGKRRSHSLGDSHIDWSLLWKTNIEIFQNMLKNYEWWDQIPFRIPF